VASPGCAVLVLNWNGVQHLRELLPSLREAVAATPFPVAVVVVDNRSTEPDVAWVRANFPEFEVVIAERNDFLFSLNPIAAARPEEIVVILNNDMRVEPDFLLPLVEAFDDPSVFASTAKVMNWDGSQQTTAPRWMEVRRWWMHKWWEMSIEAPAHTFEAGGGCSAYRRWMFAELGGYDPLYRPGYYEDVDLTYRAWQRGWSSVYEPRSVIYHRVGATLYDRSKQERFETNLARNHALFTMKNVEGWGFLAIYLLLLPVRIVRNRMIGNRAVAAGLAAAASRLPAALRGRLRASRPDRLSHAAIAALVRTPPRLSLQHQSVS
jgi:GT2 family glycosyltransferase